MSFWFILAVIAGVIAAGSLLWLVFADDTSGAFGTAVIAGLVAVAALFIGAATVVPTNSVAVVTSFGKPVGALNNGFHLTRPWASVEKFDASRQTLNMDGQGKNDDTPCITTRLGNNTTACVDVSLQWNIDRTPGNVMELRKVYKNFDRVQLDLVRRQLQNAINVAFANFDPLRAIAGTTDQPSQSHADLASAARDALVSAVKPSIDVVSVTIPYIHYDEQTEKRLTAFQQQLADTRIAEQRVLTNQKIKEANDILAASQSAKDPGVQFQNCLNLLESLAARGQLKDVPVNSIQCATGTSGSTSIVQVPGR